MNYSSEYLAGIFDGEGCVTFYKQSSCKEAYSLVVQVKMTDKRIPGILQTRFGGKVTVQFPKGNKQTAYCWRLCSGEAAKFLQEMKPFLIVKAEQAEIGIRFQERRKPAGYRRIPEVKLLDSIDKELLKMLNKRGKIDRLPVREEVV